MKTAKVLFRADRSRYSSPNKISLFYLWCFRKIQAEKSGTICLLGAQIGISLFRLLGMAVETKFVGA